MVDCCRSRHASTTAACQTCRAPGRAAVRSGAPCGISLLVRRGAEGRLSRAQELCFSYVDCYQSHTERQETLELRLE